MCIRDRHRVRLLCAGPGALWHRGVRQGRQGAQRGGKASASPVQLQMCIRDSMYAQQDRVGCVGAKLLYPDNTIQHAGIGFGFLTLAAHMHKNFPVGHPGYMGRLVYAQDVYAVTAACLMVRKSVYEPVSYTHLDVYKRQVCIR